MKEAQNSTSSRCRHFEQYSAARPRFSTRHSVHEILFKWLPSGLLTTILGYRCSWAVLFWAKHAQTPKMVAVKMVKWIIGWKNTFCWPAGFSPSRQFRVRRNDVTWTRPGYQVQLKMAASEFASFETNLYSGHFRGWNFGEWKNGMFTCHRRRQKTKLYGVTSPLKLGYFFVKPTFPFHYQAKNTYSELPFFFSLYVITIWLYRKRRLIQYKFKM